jgi:hypothetical protein
MRAVHGFLLMKMGSMTLSRPEEGSLYWTLFSVLTLPVEYCFRENNTVGEEGVSV